MVRSCSQLSFLLDVSVRTFRPKAPHVTLSSEGRPLLAASGSSWGPARCVVACSLGCRWSLAIAGVQRDWGSLFAPVMCLTLSSYLSSWMSRDCQGTVPVVWLSRRLESVGKRGAWLWNQILFWLTCMVENAVVGMSATLAEETAVKDPEDDEAFRAKDKQMGVEWFDGLRTRQRKRRGFGLVAEIETSAVANHGGQQSMLPVLLLSESRVRRCSHGTDWCGRSLRRWPSQNVGILYSSIWIWLLGSPDGPVWLHCCVLGT